MDGALELLMIVFIVLVPTVPAVIFLSLGLRRARTGSKQEEVVVGRRSDTPFVLIGWAGAAIGAVALLAVSLTLLARALS